MTKPKGKAKPKAPKAKSTRVTRLDPDAKITKLAKDNPRREGSNRAKRFDVYKNGMTVAQALEYEGVLPTGIRTDVADGLIKLTPH